MKGETRLAELLKSIDHTNPQIGEAIKIIEEAINGL